MSHLRTAFGLPAAALPEAPVRAPLKTAPPGPSIDLDALLRLGVHVRALFGRDDA
jgi:hypothetical protein